MKSIIYEQLINMQDAEYREFQSRLVPTVSLERMIGVRAPSLRVLARKMKKEGIDECFLRELPHEYYDENNLHAFLISEINDFDRCITEIERFLPHVDNWATCDGLRPKCFAKNKEKLLPFIDGWIASVHPYTVRFGEEMLMLHFLDGEDFKEEYLLKCASIISDEYYVNMMTAWFFATALALQYESAVKYIEQRRLPPFVHGMSIRKACESFRITEEHKAYLKTLRL